MEGKRVWTNLLGKDFSDLTPEENLLNNLLLHDINMGYEKPNKIRLGQSIRYNDAEAKFVHPWSHENLAYQYEFNKYSDFITFRDYMNMPAHSVDRMVAGMRKGREDREAAEKKIREEVQRKNKNKGKNTSNLHGDGDIDPVTAELLKNINESGVL